MYASGQKERHISHRCGVAFTSRDSSLPSDPIGRLYKEDVRRNSVEDVANVSAKREIPYRLEPAPLLLPHHEQRRARTILPPQHRIPAQVPDIEVRITK